MPKLDSGLPVNVPGRPVPVLGPEYEGAWRLMTGWTREVMRGSRRGDMARVTRACCSGCHRSAEGNGGLE